jgi:hypothetical protein
MTASEIKARVAAYYCLPASALQKRARGQEEPGAKRARSQAMALVRELGFTHTQIGRIFGGYHHTSVIAAVQRADRYGTLGAVREAVASPGAIARPPRTEKPRSKVDDLIDEVRGLRRDLARLRSGCETDAAEADEGERMAMPEGVQ